MHLYHNKKSEVGGFLVGVLIVIAAFLIIFAILGMLRDKAEAAGSAILCKGNVAMRARTYTELHIPLPILPDLKVGTVAAPLILCKTNEFNLPLDKKDTEEDIKRQFADLMATCWNTYGEGLIEDPIRRGDSLGENCQTCYTINLKKTSEFNVEITNMEFIQYLFTTPYKVTSDDDNCKITGGFCIEEEEAYYCTSKIDLRTTNGDRLSDEELLIDTESAVCRKKYTKERSCCYTDYQCLNRGGRCSEENPGEGGDVDLYQEYDFWECPGELKCFVERGNYYTYGEYIQRFGGPGNIFVFTNIAPEGTYAISFGSPNIGCGWKCKLGGKLGMVAGAVGGGLVVVGIVGSPFSGGTSLVLVGAGVAIGAWAGGVGGEAAVQAISEEYMSGEDLFKRDGNTIYLTTLDFVHEGNLCSVDIA